MIRTRRVIVSTFPRSDPHRVRRGGWPTAAAAAAARGPVVGQVVDCRRGAPGPGNRGTNPRVRGRPWRGQGDRVTSLPDVETARTFRSGPLPWRDVRRTPPATVRRSVVEGTFHDAQEG